MTTQTLRDRLTDAQAQQQVLVQQRARVHDLLTETIAQWHASQGRIQELRDLIALMESDGDQ